MEEAKEPYFNFERRIKAQDWLVNKCNTKAPKKCDWCGKHTWYLGDELMGCVPYDGHTYMGVMTPQPCFALVCGNCGSTKYFNAVMSGVAQ